MAVRSTSQIKPGERLKEEVHTPLGGVLFQKGWLLRDREIQILKAFLIRQVAIETDEDEKDDEQTVQNTSTEEVPPLFNEYEKMFKFIKQLFPNIAANSSQPIPMLELRNHLQALLDHISNYNVLSFSPTKIKEQDYIYHTSVLVAMTTYLMAGWFGLPKKDHFPIALAGLFHDIGNVEVDPEILNKSGKLTDEEVQEVKRHTIIGYNMLKKVPAINEGVKLAALQHHEKEDGSGYPLGVKGDKIHIYAKIIAIADIYHAMTNKRNYKNAQSPYLVLEQLYNEAFGKLEPGMVQTFITKLTQIHNGTLVRLSDNEIGEIVFTDRSHPTRPWVKVDGRIVNLATNRSLYIKEIIKK